MKTAHLKTRILLVMLFTGFVFVSTPAMAAREITVNVRIEGYGSQVLHRDVDLPEECTVTDTGGVNHNYSGYKAVCALQALQDQAMVNYQMVDFGFGLYLSEINSLTHPDPTAFWILYYNDSSSFTGLTDLSLNAEDEIVLAHGVTTGPPNYAFPTLLSVTKSGDATQIGSNLIFQAQNWNGSAYENLSDNVTFYVNGRSFESTDGTLEWKLDTVEKVSVYVQSDSTKIRSAKLAFDEINEDSTLSAATARDTLNPAEATIFAIEYQDYGGSFASSTLVTDWMAIALAASLNDSTELNKVKNYLIDNPSPGTLVTDFERRAMALLALGLNPHDVNGVNYIKPITDSFDGEQVGNPDFINDDVFGLLVLRKAGFGLGHKTITTVKDHILSAQNTDGSWPGGVDMTAAAIQSLLTVKNLKNVGPALESAELYLRRAQQDDGGFGNEFSTAWAIQAISALGKSESDWYKNNKTPGEYLGELQAEDGGLLADQSDTMRVWATAYAIPAELSLSWLDILQEINLTQAPPLETVPEVFEAHEIFTEPDEFIAAPEPVPSTPDLTTSTIDFTTPTTATTTPTTSTPGITTSTPDFTTSTLQQVNTSTPSTPSTTTTTSTVLTIPTTSTIDFTTPEITSSTDSVTSTTTSTTTRTPEPVQIAPRDDQKARQAITDQAQPNQTDKESSIISNDEPDLLEAITLATTTETISPATSTQPNDTPLQRTARNVFNTSVALAATLGAYLSWRAIQTIV